jgi:putative addiction module killer protein
MKTGTPKQIEYYVTTDDRSPFVEWFEALPDKEAKARIQKRLDRLSLGNPGEYKVLAEDIFELKIRYGPGYRIYCGDVNDQIVMLLCGGDKKSKNEQSEDIAQAKELWADYQARRGAQENG